MGSKSSVTPLIVIVGETASGKTAAAISVAQKVGGEIICADSRTVYKKMDIGTAKPSKAEQKLIPHHLIDIVEPNEKFTAAEFKRLAQKCIQEISERGKIPILVGGTGLYVDAVLYNFQFKDKPNDELRDQLQQMNDDELTTLMNTKNINTGNLNTKNRRHVIRAIERNGEAPSNTKLRSNTLVTGLKLDREVLRERVTARVEQMFKGDLLAEAQQLFDEYGIGTEAFRTPGYNALKLYLADEITFEEAKALFVQADMQLARRQRTWFKRSDTIQWFDDPKALIAKAVEFIKHQPLDPSSDE